MYIKKIKELIIGSNNKGKIREIKDLLPKQVKIYDTKSLKIRSPKENQNTFIRNSLLKAKHYSKISNKICLADDSGLEINILNKAPGIYSSRWAGKNNDFSLAIKKIYNKIKNKNHNWKNKKINAKFKCALTIYGPNFKTISVLGIVDGYISKKKMGNLGFGYDPIFIPKGKKKTFGQMQPKQKHKLDHRFKAFKKIKKFF